MNTLETLDFLSDGERMIVPALASCHRFSFACDFSTDDRFDYTNDIATKSRVGEQLDLASELE